MTNEELKNRYESINNHYSDFINAYNSKPIREVESIIFMTYTEISMNSELRYLFLGISDSDSFDKELNNEKYHSPETFRKMIKKLLYKIKDKINNVS